MEAGSRGNTMNYLCRCLSTYLARTLTALMKLLIKFSMFGVLALLPSLAFGYGSRVSNQDAEATARGNAFTATADDPSAIYYNPAGIMQLDGLNTESGMYGIWID